MIRVFVAEDHPMVRSGISLIIDSQADMEVAGDASDGNSTVAGVCETSPDVVLMDLDMPGISGVEATRRIRELAPETSILIFTGHEQDDLLFSALQAGATGYALKSIKVGDLLSAIRTVYAGEVCISPRMATKLVDEYLKGTNQGESSDPFRKLSLREKEVLPMLAGGQSNVEIANVLQISPYTIQTYKQRIMKKLNLHSGTELLKFALRNGLVSLDQ